MAQEPNGDIAPLDGNLEIDSNNELFETLDEKTRSA